jgi:acyl carrier protein
MNTTAEHSEAELLEALREIFRDGLGVDPISPIEPETRFFADLGLASIDAVVLGEMIQAHFARPLPYEVLMAEIGARSERDIAISELIAFLKTHL